MTDIESMMDELFNEQFVLDATLRYRMKAYTAAPVLTGPVLRALRARVCADAVTRFNQKVHHESRTLNTLNSFATAWNECQLRAGLRLPELEAGATLMESLSTTDKR